MKTTMEAVFELKKIFFGRVYEDNSISNLLENVWIQYRFNIACEI